MSANVVPLRDRQKAATAELILAAASRCLEEVELSDLSFARIAAEAGISERTVYRHCPTKEALLDAWWQAHKEDIGNPNYYSTADELIALPRRVYQNFSERAALMRGVVFSLQGKELRRRAAPIRRAAIEASVRDAVGDLPEPHFSRLCAAVRVLYSADGWFLMTDEWGLSGAEAGIATSEAIATLLGHAPGGNPKASEDTEKEPSR